MEYGLINKKCTTIKVIPLQYKQYSSLSSQPKTLKHVTHKHTSDVTAHSNPRNNEEQEQVDCILMQTVLFPRDNQRNGVENPFVLNSPYRDITRFSIPPHKISFTWSKVFRIKITKEQCSIHTFIISHDTSIPQLILSL